VSCFERRRIAEEDRIANSYRGRIGCLVSTAKDHAVVALNGIIAKHEPVAEIVIVARDPVKALRNISDAIYIEARSCSPLNIIAHGFRSICRPQSYLLSLLERDDSVIVVGY
jgi:hypothetical protein